MGLTQEVSFRNLSLTKKNIFSKNVPTKHFTRLDLIKGLHLPKYNKVDESFMNIFINSLSVGSGVGLTGGFKKIVEPNVVYKPSSISKSKVGLTPGLKPVFMTKSENEFEEFFMPFVDTGMGVKSDVDLGTGTVTPQRQSMDTMFPPVVYPVSVVVKPVKSTFINPPAMKAASGGIVPPVLPFPKGLGGWGTSGYPDLDDFKLRYSLKRFKADPYRYVSPFKNKKVIRRIGF